MTASRALLPLALAFLLGFGPAAPAGPPADPPAPKLNKKVEGVRFVDDLRDAKSVVVVFLSFECPVSNGYAPALADLARDFGPRGVKFVGVCPGEDDATEIARQAREQHLPFPVFADPKRAAVDAFKAGTTPEVFVLDHNHVLRYRGRIDDGYTARLKRSQVVKRQDLKVALEELLAGKPVSEPAAPAVGCPITRADENRPATGPVTYYRDVLPILQQNCQGCHRPGQVGPFSLMSYKQAVHWGQDIKSYTESHQMPPWKPVAGPEFVGQRRLPDEQVATLAKWVDGGMPPGDPKDAPPPGQFPDGWQLGQPDLVLTVPDEMTVGPSGPDLFRVFVLPTGLTEDKHVVAFEVKPGNPRIVHHTLNFFDTTGSARERERQEKQRARADDQDRGPGYSSAMGIGLRPGLGIPRGDGVPAFGGLGGWAPGAVSRFLPEGTGYYLPRGSDILLQVHYHRDGRAEKDRTQIGLFFAKQPVKYPWRTITVPGRVLLGIPSDDPAYKVRGSVWVHSDCTLRSVMPHMHLLGKSVRVTLTPPDGPAKTLVAIDDWDYNWQETYFFKTPIPVKAGTRLDIEATYDNSSANPNNPFHPPQRVFFGEHTTNEMLFGFLGATSDRPGRIRVDLRPPQPAKPDGK